LLVLVFLAGLALILYPVVSDWYNSLHQSKAVADYTAQVADLDETQYQAVLTRAQQYNESLAQRTGARFSLTDEETEDYLSQLNVSDVIGSIEIPSINCTLPIYHTTSESVLEAGVGHLPGSSLPVGGESTHCVLSGHRGLPEAKLFTDLDQLAEGDIFVLRTLGETLTYEVDQILVVDPDDVSALAIVPGEDLCTLVTCTPYGVNTHRLLVRGHRVENQVQAALLRVTADAVQLDPLVAAPFAALPILAVMLFWVLRRPGGKKQMQNRKDGSTS
jgi:sortase A